MGQNRRKVQRHRGYVNSRIMLNKFLEYRSSKSKERQSFNYGPRGRHRAKEQKHVQVFELPKISLKMKEMHWDIKLQFSQDRLRMLLHWMLYKNVS
ncbi:uncharacterized protein LOC115787016 isoform X1 [Archocentrus centrarchus]|uniref:uncharacterized protein LOC115781239 isoform X2 n=1 Tax=Archocentrus centrarchus TaxID=63155 RepID=UPI0011EA45EA|nr:uncharacterized protein LOC115781239 isoform X2 [Archocentrus centrarchus]XP_030594564.1 uncharacterized protein LOC115786521 isoform X3 [Archocentrus centrarchus]XP_030595428.1 uncharacterized protein LOC115787016 isoform X1 [Archocentrus centrarchus]